MDAEVRDAIDQLANKLRQFDWERFIDASDIKVSSQTNPVLFQKLKDAWELSHPLSHYLDGALSQIGLASD